MSCWPMESQALGMATRIGGDSGKLRISLGLGLLTSVNLEEKISQVLPGLQF